MSDYYRCPVCDRQSWDPRDIRDRHCSYCYVGDVAGSPSISRELRTVWIAPTGAPMPDAFDSPIPDGYRHVYDTYLDLLVFGRSRKGSSGEQDGSIFGVLTMARHYAVSLPGAAAGPWSMVIDGPTYRAVIPRVAFYGGDPARWCWVKVSRPPGARWLYTVLIPAAHQRGVDRPGGGLLPWE